MESKTPDDLAYIARLIQTAVYDTSGELVEGAFVDHWVRNADSAIAELEEIFETEGFSSADEALIRAEICEPKAPVDAVVALVHGLSQYTRPLVVELRQDTMACARAVCVRAGARIYDPLFWLDALQDADAGVRIAAITAVIEQRQKLSGAQDYLRSALGDADPTVRRLAGTSISIYKHLDNAEALVRCLQVEAEASVRNAILAAIALSVRSAGTRDGADRIAAGIGEPMKTMLLAELNNEDAETRREIASALERLRGVDVATALFDRLLIETVPRVRQAIVNFDGFAVIAERAIPILSSLLTADADPVVRMRIAWSLEKFGASTLPLLIAALDDGGGARRAAAMVLRNMGRVRALPALSRFLAEPASPSERSELLAAIRDILVVEGHVRPAVPPIEVSQRIQQRIDEPAPERGWGYPVSYCLDVLNAYPLHSNLIYMWAIHPDGTLLCMDHEAFSHATEPETDPLIHFAVMVNGARSYPELQALIPQPPKRTQPCLQCNTTGWADDGKGGTEVCARVSGFGWYVAR